ncbi:protein kinase [Glutamicibacter sp. NPDC087583]|uniref:protein kinase domain-containing protein n=1 Tax=Glutamicibacter sp. NPDC087583 TaxID=3363995 RepID=UPI0037F554D1
MSGVVHRLPYEAIVSMPEGINEVRLYRDEILKCDVVGKRLDLSMVDEKTLPEASTLKSISHPNVVTVRSASHVDGYVNDPTMRIIEIVTDYYPRGSITDALLKGEFFSGNEAVAIVRNALSGLRELHTKHGICHRDVKSGNILLTDPPVHSLIADLGVAGLFDEKGEVEAVNNPTLYSPPELLTTGVLTAGSDLYSMALVLRELVGGRFPYENYTREGVVHALQRGASPLSSQDLQLPPWAPKTLRRVYSKALHRDPNKRFGSAKDMDSALSKVRIASWKRIDESSWEARKNVDDNFCIRVDVRKTRLGLNMTVRSNRSGKFRRFQGYPDVQVPSLESKEAQQVFDAANTYAF